MPWLDSFIDVVENYFQASRPLVKKNYNSFASKCMKRAAIKNAMVVSMGRILQNQVAAMCSDNFESILRLKTKDSVKDINYIISTINKELNSKAPTLLSLLQWCLKKKVRSNIDELIAYHSCANIEDPQYASFRELFHLYCTLDTQASK